MHFRFTLLSLLMATVTASLSSPTAFISQQRTDSLSVPHFEAAETPAADAIFGLRGGAMGVEKDLALKATYFVAGAYGLQFFLAPKFTIEQNFEVTVDDYHSFLGRFCGMTMLVAIYALTKMDVDVSFPISFGWNVLVAIFGPAYAEFCLKTTPMHKMGVGLVSAVLLTHALAAL